MMKKKILCGLFAGISILGIALGVESTSNEVCADPGDVIINANNFSDAAFREYLSSEKDSNRDGTLSATEIAAIDSINIDQSYTGNVNFTNFGGIEKLTSLYSFQLIHNDAEYTNIDFSNNNLMRFISVQGEGNSVTLGNQPNLEILQITGSNMTAINIGQCPSLTFCKIEANLTSIDLSQNPLIETLLLDGNQNLTQVNVTSLNGLEKLSLCNTGISTIDLSGNPVLKSLSAGKTNLSTVDISQNPILETLYIYECPNVRTFSASHNNLKTLLIYNCNLTYLDVSGLTALEFLRAENNHLMPVDIGNPDWSQGATYWVYGQTATVPYIYDGNQYYADLSGYNISASRVGTIDGATYDAARKRIVFENDVTSTVNFNYLYRPTTYMYTALTMEPMSVVINDITFPDEVFQNYVATNLDQNHDGMLSSAEQNITSLNVAGLGIADLTGIEFFDKLTTLNVSNNHLAVLDLSNNTLLTNLSADSNTVEAEAVYDGNETNIDISSFNALATKVTPLDAGIYDNGKLIYNRKIGVGGNGGYDYETGKGSLHVIVTVSHLTDNTPTTASKSTASTSDGTVSTVDNSTTEANAANVNSSTPKTGDDVPLWGIGIGLFMLLIGNIVLTGVKRNK